METPIRISPIPPKPGESSISPPTTAKTPIIVIEIGNKIFTIFISYNFL